MHASGRENVGTLTCCAHAPPLVLRILGFERKLPKFVQWYYGWRSPIIGDAARDRMIQCRVG